MFGFSLVNMKRKQRCFGFVILWYVALLLVVYAGLLGPGAHSKAALLVHPQGTINTEAARSNRLPLHSRGVVAKQKISEDYLANCE